MKMLTLCLVLFLLTVASIAHAQVVGDTLRWTAPGDDGNVGKATSYDMRYSATAPDTTSSAAMASWWSSATLVAGMPAPAIAGTPQIKYVAPIGGFLYDTTYYFVIRARDEAGNQGSYSNVAWRRWTAPDVTPPGPITDLR